jgi:hypothetical protein
LTYEQLIALVGVSCNPIDGESPASAATLSHLGGHILIIRRNQQWRCTPKGKKIADYLCANALYFSSLIIEATGLSDMLPPCRPLTGWEMTTFLSIASRRAVSGEISHNEYKNLARYGLIEKRPMNGWTLWCPTDVGYKLVAVLLKGAAKMMERLEAW